MSSYIQFQFHRKSRMVKKRFGQWRIWAQNYTARHIYGGWQKLASTKTIVIVILLVASVSLWGFWQADRTMSSRYLVASPSSGGTYSEGLVGNVVAANPLFPTTPATSDVNAVVFSGLTRVNSDRQIAPDLAESWEISSDKKIYTFSLRKNALWHDGKPVTAKDVAFTINRIQNPDTRSPLATNWNSVKYEVIDDYTIRLSLPTSYAPFLYNTTLGIIPQHLLESVKPERLRTVEFNQKPIGSGPYRLDDIPENASVLSLKAYDKYYFGEPYVSNLQFVLYNSQHDYLTGFQKKQISGFVIEKPSIAKQASEISDLTIRQLSLPAYAAAFFNTSSPAANNATFRHALAHATDRNAIVSSSLNNQAVAAYYPILPGYTGFDKSAPKYQYSVATARSLLESIPEAQRPTRLRLATLKDSTYEQVASQLKEQWKQIGIEVDILALPLEELQQYYIRTRNYDVLLYGQDIGYDSDLYAFWHSSQSKDPGSNLSGYSNKTADMYLETGRTAKDLVYKTSRYQAFLQTWSKDLPAIVLYSPYFDYAQVSDLEGIKAKKLVEPSNRFFDIHSWYLETKQTAKSKTDSE